MFRSATFKLTVWYLGLATAISLIFSVVVYHIAANEIAHGIYLQSQRIYNQFPVFDNNPILKPRSDIMTDDHLLLFRLVIFNIFVLVFAGLASYLLAKQTLDPIRQAHEQQKRFTADVSHELRTPLTVLRMESEVALLANDAPKKELRKTLESNLEEVSKLEALINNLLRLTRLEADELRQNFVNVSTKTVAEEAINQLHKLAEDRLVTINSKLIDKTIYGDPASITQLLVIILDNAVKYSPSGSTINFDLKQKTQQVVFSVKDNGVGISKQALDHIFDRFYRANVSRTKEGEKEGHGLGLSIAKMIADLHGANIIVSSQLGKGTTVGIYFNIVQPPSN